MDSKFLGQQLLLLFFTHTTSITVGHSARYNDTKPDDASVEVELDMSAAAGGSAASGRRLGRPTTSTILEEPLLERDQQQQLDSSSPLRVQVPL